MKKVKKGGVGAPFQKGGDPRINMLGRPRTGAAVADLIRERLAGGKGEAIVDGMISRSLEGSDQATKILLDRGYGQAPQTVDMNIDHGSQMWGETVMEMMRDYFEQKHPDLIEEFIAFAMERGI